MDWLPEGHLARFISKVVDKMDLTDFFAPYEEDGRRNKPYHPAMMVKVLIYAYAVGIRSSRKIASAMYTDVPLRFLGAGNWPSHRTICAFRKRHLKDIRALFVDVVRMAQRAGKVKFGQLSIDGTKVRANASKRKAMSYDRILRERARLRKEIDVLLSQADAVDGQEDAVLGAAANGNEGMEMPEKDQALAVLHAGLNEERRVEADRASQQADADVNTAPPSEPAEEAPPRTKGDSVSVPEGSTVAEEVALRQKKLAVLEDAKVRLEERQRATDETKGRNPEKTYRRPFGQPEAKAQSNFTDPESRIMKTSQEGFQQSFSAQTVVDAQHQIIVETHVSNDPTDRGKLIPMLDAVEETYGQRPKEVLADAGYCTEATLRTLEERKVDGYVATGREGKKEKTINPKTRPATARMQQKLRTRSGRSKYRRRKWLSEAPNGWIKERLGFRRFSVRGLENVRGEWDLMCLSLNLRRMCVEQGGMVS